LPAEASRALELLACCVELFDFAVWLFAVDVCFGAEAVLFVRLLVVAGELACTDGWLFTVPGEALVEPLFIAFELLLEAVVLSVPVLVVESAVVPDVMLLLPDVMLLPDVILLPDEALPLVERSLAPAATLPLLLMLAPDAPASAVLVFPLAMLFAAGDPASAPVLALAADVPSLLELDAAALLLPAMLALAPVPG